MRAVERGFKILQGRGFSSVQSGMGGCKPTRSISARKGKMNVEDIEVQKHQLVPYLDCIIRGMNGAFTAHSSSLPVFDTTALGALTGRSVGIFVLFF